MTVTEQAKQLEITDRCDVLVCGGGVAGISAALAAARGGAEVLLLEREWLLGGLATAGLVTVYLPLCDGYGKQVSFGIAEELLKLSIKHGAESGENPWLSGGSDEEKAKQRYVAQFNPNLFAFEAEKLLLESGVRLLYGTAVCGAVTDGGKITHIIIENKSGRSAIAAESVIDCTGDADICRRAGVGQCVLYQQVFTAHDQHLHGRTAQSLGDQSGRHVAAGGPGQVGDAVFLGNGEFRCR